MKKLIIIVAIIVFTLSLNKNYELNKNNTIRFRVIANSDTLEDQEIKKEIVKNVSGVINESQKSTSIEETRTYINNKLPEFNEVVEKTLLENNDKRDFKINYGLNYFPKKELNNEEYPEGMYESLVITLGKGQGDNFWCILFPPLCMIEEKEDYEYKSFIKEIFDSIFE
ncbi:MAG: stage II sporulation protein R [Bacilli bacterium]|nr:stage II sporulation protein R [Bacilli bacterium]